MRTLYLMLIIVIGNTHLPSTYTMHNDQQKSSNCYVCILPKKQAECIDHTRVYGCFHDAVLCTECARDNLAHGHSACPLCRKDPGIHSVARTLNSGLTIRSTIQSMKQHMQHMFNEQALMNITHCYLMFTAAYMGIPIELDDAADNED